MKATEMSGKVVVVTGASSGIGLAAARRFAAGGARVLLAARRRDRLEREAGEITSAGGEATAFACDVTSPEQVAALAEEVDRRFGRLDVLVNNAGIGLFGPIEAVTEQQLRTLFEVNVLGLLRVTRSMLPLLRRAGGGQVVNVSSVLGHRGVPFLAGYAASKAAVNSLTESLRVELASDGIQVLLVSPGLTTSEFREVRMHAPGYGPEPVPLRAMSAEAVAEAIVRACRRGKRQTVLTSVGRATVLANRLFPGLVDFLALRLVGRPSKVAR